MKKVVKTILMDLSGNILFLVRGATHPRFPHEADLPGGIIEQNETTKNALIREVREECSIDINNAKTYKLEECNYNSNWYYMLAISICDSLLPKLSWEHEGYFVCNLKDIQTNTKLANAKDPYMKFAYKSLCDNSNRLFKLIDNISSKVEN